MKFKHYSSLILASFVALIHVFVYAEDITSSVRSASKATYTLVNGRVTAGALSRAFDGEYGYKNSIYCLLTATSEAEGFVPPSEENPIIIDYVIADDFRPGEDIIASRFQIWGINNYYYRSGTTDYRTSAPSRYEIYGSNDGETWNKLVDDKGLEAPGSKASNNLFVPFKNRASYRRYRFKFTKNNGYTGTDRGQLFIMNINIISDKAIYVAPDGSNDADGSSWANATTPTNAVRLANNAEYSEIRCKAGRYLLPASCVYTKRVSQIGGFAGDDSDPLAMDPSGERSIYDGGGSVAYGFQDDTTAGNYLSGQFDYVENMEFCNMTEAGLYKAGSQSIECHNCRFAANRNATTGRGVNLTGQQNNNVSYARFFFYDCEILGNGFTSASGTLTSEFYGSGIYATSGRLILDNCLFVSNGVPESAEAWTGSNSWCHRGSAIYCNKSTLTATNCRFLRNRAFGGKNKNNDFSGGGSVYVSGASGVLNATTLRNCSFVANEDVYTTRGVGSTYGGLVLASGSAYSNIIENCTFAYNTADGTKASAGMTLLSGVAAVTNSIFYGNRVGTSATVGADVYVSSGKIIVGHTLFTSSASVTGASASNLSLGEGVIYGDPLFVSSLSDFQSCIATTGRLHFDSAKSAESLALDVHLKTPAGYRKNGSEELFTDALLASPAIDAGDPASEFSNEPQPNGGRVNLGVYGNTAESSRTPAEASFQIQPIKVQFFDGVNPCEPEPVIVDKSSGEVIDSSDFEFTYVDNLSYGSATITATGRNGTAYAGQSASASFTIAARFRVTALSLENEGTGFSWESPMSLTNAIAKATRKEDEILVKAGTYEVTSSIVVPRPMTIRGGYAGTEGDEMAEVPETVLDGGGTLAGNIMSVTAATESTDITRIENIAFIRSCRRGFVKNGITSLMLVNCRIENNRNNGEDDFNGIGAFFGGTVGFTEVTLSNCIVRANQDAVTDWRCIYGHGVFANNLAVLRLINTDFIANGIDPSSNYNTTRAFGDYVRGFALYANSAPVVAEGCEFRLNRGYTRYPNGTRDITGGIVCVLGNGGGTSFNNCLFAGNATCKGDSPNGPGNVDGTLFMSFDTVSRDASVNNCTFFGNIADTLGGSAGVHFNKGKFTLSNSIFAHNIVGSYALYGADVHLAEGSLVVKRCLFGGNGSKWVSAAEGANLTFEGGTGDIIFGDPRTVTSAETVLSTLGGASAKSMPSSPSPLYFAVAEENIASVLAFDAHLLSGAGYKKNGSSEWFVDTLVVSPAIDAADPAAPFANEVEPNGARANLGCYGNTAEASKTATGVPEVPMQVEITYPDGYSQAQIGFVVGGEGTFNATVTIGVYTNSVLVGTSSFYGVSNGDRVEYVLPHYLPTGTPIRITLEALSLGGSSQSEVDGSITAPLPPWYGRGGPANVIHVRVGATGQCNGTNWTDAYADFHSALKAITAEKNEIWFAGTNECVDPYTTIVLPAPVVVRGGFTGMENSADERVDGTMSVVIGRSIVNTMSVSSDYPLYVERIVFRKSREAGISKTGSGNLSLSNCEIESCGYGLGVAYGYGLAVEGSASATYFSATNCVFAGNGIPRASGSRNSSGYGFGASLRNLLRATLDGCLFVTNGIPFSQPIANTFGYQNAAGSAIYADNAPITARNCRFVCNRAWSSSMSGGTVRIEKTSLESAFTNCLWLANQNSVQGYGQENTGGGGEIYFSPGSSAASCDVVNCTFAANLNDIWKDGGGGLNVRSGIMRVKNSIFNGNLLTRSKSGTGSDVYVAPGAVVEASYSLFSADTTNALFVAEGGELVRGAGLRFGDAGFVSTMGDARYMLEYGSSAIAYVAAAFRNLSTLNVHLRSHAGYVDETRGVRVYAYGSQSQAVDAGDPESDCSREPKKSWGYSGRRVNLGFYGNTPYATATPYQGLVIYVGGSGARVERPALPDELPTETIGGGASSQPLALEDIIVCDQADQAIKIYRGTDVVWRWAGAEDTSIPSNDRSGFSGNVAECKIVNDGTAVAMAANGGRWAIVGLAQTNVLAYGKSKGWPHSIELLPNNIVAVAATDTSDPANKGLYLYDISGSKAMSPNSQNRKHFVMDNPHGLYWDPVTERLYVSDTQGLHRCRVGYDGSEFTLDIEESWLIAPLGLTYAHDLMPMPNSRLLVMTTYEQILFFDMDTSSWRNDLAIWRKDAKCFDPHRDGVHFLATVPKSGFSPSWATDTIETYSSSESFRAYLVIPGSKIYKARWVGK